MPPKLTHDQWAVLCQIDQGSLSGTGVNRKSLDRLAELGLTNCSRGYVAISPAGKRVIAERLAATDKRHGS